jgi:DNA-binding transcriptional ArsR family regulator
MTNHYHIVIETPETNLSKGMRQLNGVYTQRFNRRHRLAGHLYQGRFKGILVEQDSYLLELARYVVLNPVRAGMVSSAEEWSWSSYLTMMGETERPAWLETDWILGQFSDDRTQAQIRYRDFIAAGVGQSSIWSDLRNQVFLGSDGFVDKVRQSKSLNSGSLREVPRKQRRPLAKPLAAIEKEYSNRREAMARAYLTGEYTMSEIAGHFGVHYSTVSRALKWFENSQMLDFKT